MNEYVINLIREKKSNIESEIAHHKWWINRKWFPKFWKNIISKELPKLERLQQQCNEFLISNERKSVRKHEQNIEFCKCNIKRPNRYKDGKHKCSDCNKIIA